MLRVGLTGGIGAGKSAVATCLVDRGAQLIDSDVLAREVVAPGTEGLDEVIAVFGTQVLDATGALDRAALASRVFDDSAARARLEQIVHPRVRSESEARMAAAAADAVVVNDVPLLVEVGLAPTFDLVAVVEAPETTRLRRLEDRGLSAASARSRIASQLSERQRRVVADVIIDNSGGLEELRRTVARLWTHRVLPFEDNKRHGRVAAAPWRLEVAGEVQRDRFTRVAERLRYLLDGQDPKIDHIGPTAVPGLLAWGVVDVQVNVAADDLPAAAATLTAAGFPAGATARVHGSADPGNPRTVWLCAADDPEARARLALRDYLRGHAGAREELSAQVRDCGSQTQYQAMWSNWYHDHRGHITGS